jgi:acetyl-CoA carboxylase biotin carboxyl carrier protein
MAVRLRKASAAAPAAVAPAAAPVAAAAPAAGAAAQAARPPKENLPSINSPMVGTFYVAASPEAAPLVEIGDHVAEDTVVCVIEAMKVFNEIQAEMSGTIEKVLAKNAEAVEFGQPMFVVRPD